MNAILRGVMVRCARLYRAWGPPQFHRWVYIIGCSVVVWLVGAAVYRLAPFRTRVFDHLPLLCAWVASIFAIGACCYWAWTTEQLGRLSLVHCRRYPPTLLAIAVGLALTLVAAALGWIAPITAQKSDAPFLGVLLAATAAMLSCCFTAATAKLL